jgi:hypothetical protein
MLQRQYAAVPPAVEQRRGEAVQFEHAFARQGATVQAFADHALSILRLQRIGELQIGDVVEGYRCKVFPCVVAEAEVPAVDHQAGPPAAVRGPHGVHAVVDRRNRAQRGVFHRHACADTVKQLGAALNALRWDRRREDG